MKLLLSRLPSWIAHFFISLSTFLYSPLDMATAPIIIAPQHPELTYPPEPHDDKPSCDCFSKVSPCIKQFSDFFTTFQNQCKVLDNLSADIHTTTRLLLSLSRSDTTPRGRWSPDNPLTPINLSAVVLDWLSVDAGDGSRTLRNSMNDIPTPNILGSQPPYDEAREAYVRTLPWFAAISEDGPHLILNIFSDVYRNSICPANGVFEQTLILKDRFCDLWDACCRVEQAWRLCFDHCENDNDGMGPLCSMTRQQTLETEITADDAREVLTDYVRNMIGVVASFRLMMEALINGLKASKRNEEREGDIDLAERISEAVDRLREMRGRSVSEFDSFEIFVSDIRAQEMPAEISVGSYEPSGLQEGGQS